MIPPSEMRNTASGMITDFVFLSCVSAATERRADASAKRVRMIKITQSDVWLSAGTLVALHIENLTKRVLDGDKIGGVGHHDIDVLVRAGNFIDERRAVAVLDTLH